METTITATEFKARCLELMDRVCETREAIVITKRGKPVGRLEPPKLAPPKRKFVGCMQGEMSALAHLPAETSVFDADDLHYPT
jgi:prevent-host-death family protein